MPSEAILIFWKRKAAGYSSPICRCFLITNPGQTPGHPKESGKGVSKPNAVTAYQTCAFRICRLQMVRSSTLCIPYDKHKNACFQRNRHTKKPKGLFERNWTFFGSLSSSIKQVSWLTDLHIFLSFSYKKLYNGFVRKYSLFTVTGSLKTCTWFPFPAGIINLTGT